MTTAVLKRKMNSELIFSPTIDIGSGPKRAKSVSQKQEIFHPNIVNNNENILNEESRCRVLTVLKTLMQHIFALPFIKQTDDDGRLFLEDICENVENDRVSTLEEIMNQVNKVIEDALKSEGKLELGGKMLYYKNADVELMASQLKKEFEHLYQESCNKLLRRSCSVNNSLSDIVKQGEHEDQVFQKLKARYEHVPEYILLAKALDINLGQDVDINFVESELNELENQNITSSQPKYRTYKFYPSKYHDFDIEKVHHSYIAGYQFHKMITKASKAPIAMRTILDISDSIESITYIENDDSSLKYEEQRRLFETEGKVDENGKVREVLLFHGTAVASVENILSENFLVDALPLQVNTSNEARKKAMMFGTGVYFSELPAVSLMYGNGLLLCKVMLGECEVFKPSGTSPPEISSSHDSREVRGVDGQGVVHVVKRPAQILPYCVITLKNQSLSTQYVRLNQQQQHQCNNNFKSVMQQQQCINQAVINNKKQQQPKYNSDWNIVRVGRDVSAKVENKTFAAAETVRIHSSESSCGGGVCSVCQESLSDDVVSLAQCGHHFHFDCLVQLVEHQPSQSYVQCPNCQQVQGVKTGNMPSSGHMMWSRQSLSLPGYPDCGMIMIKYVMNDGVQDDSHPSPGQPYHASSFPRAGALPDNVEGNKVLRLLITAFQRRLTFTIGRSVTRGEDNCVVWNGIHHKTSIRDNGSGHGYPDMGYLERVTEELRQHGVTDD